MLSLLQRSAFRSGCSLSIADATRFARSISHSADWESTTVIPAALGESETAEVRRMAIEAFKAVEGSGMARVDFFLSRDSGTLFVNEVNTIPGFTTISMYPKMWEASGVPYPALLDRLIQLAIERHSQKQQLRTSITDGHP